MGNQTVQSLLECPGCSGRLQWDSLGTWRAAQFGILRCAEHEWPVVYDIPIFLEQPPVPIVLALVHQQRFKEALLVALASAFPKTKGNFVERREKVQMVLLRKTATFDQALSLLPWWGKYFARFFSSSAYKNQKRHVETVLKADGPFLDLCSGPGQLVWSLQRETFRRLFVCVDYLFYLLFFAKRFFPTRALYICTDANRRLPFQKEVFSSGICAGAFENIRNKRKLLSEIRRLLLPGGIFALTGLRSKGGVRILCR